MDDVFVTGMLAEKANVSHRDISDLITFYEDWDEEVLLTGNVWWVSHFNLCTLHSAGRICTL